MTPEVQMQFIAALIESGDLSLPKRLGIEPTLLTHVPAAQALDLIYEYADNHSGGVPGTAYLGERLIQVPSREPSVGDLTSLCAVIRSSALRARVLAFTQEVARAAVQDPMEAYSRVLEFGSQPDVQSLVSSGESGSLAYDYRGIISDYRDTMGTQGVTGVETPFPSLTQSIKGWQRGGFYIIYANAKNYKTFVALAAIKHMYLRRRRTLVVSTEMSQRQMNVRLVCMILGIDYNQFLDRTLPTDVWEEIQEEVETFEARATTTVHHFTPAGLGAKAVNEVKAKIQELNVDGELSLVLWDGHYRSSKSDNWEDVYDLTRRTRAIPLDEATGNVPLLITTQAGSKKGEVAYKAYEQEASVLMLLEKEAPGQFTLWTKAIRQGLGCRLRGSINFTNGRIEEVERLADEDDLGAVTIF